MKERVWVLGDDTDELYDFKNLDVLKLLWLILRPDLVSRLHIQFRLMGNSYLNSGSPWLSNTDGSLRFICKKNTQKCAKQIGTI